MFDSRQIFDARWFQMNEASAQEAMKAAHIWYGPGHVPPVVKRPKPAPVPELIIETVEAHPPEPVIEPLPILAPTIPRAWKRKRIMLAITDVTGITVEQMRSQSRCKKFVEARRIASWLLQQECGLSSPAIGRAINRDHSSVLSAIRRCGEKQFVIIEQVKALLQS